MKSCEHAKHTIATASAQNFGFKSKQLAH